MTKDLPQKTESIPKPPKKRKKRVAGLDLKNELFCQYYAGLVDRHCMSNGVLSYMAAYGVDAPTGKIQIKVDKKSAAFWDYHPLYKSAKTQASLLLTKNDIKLRIHTLFKLHFSNDTTDNELLKAIMQMEDWKAKVAAIREFNELKGRITKKVKLSGGVRSNLNDEQLAKIAQVVLKKKITK